MMQERQLFEYAVIRFVPCVEREEFINVGVILFCQSQNFLDTRFKLNEEKLKAIAPGVEICEIEDRLSAFSKICSGRKTGGKIGELPLSGRFRWLTATRSTVIQTSSVHPGLCDNAGETLERLFSQLVL
jgi:hypothetical protein